MRTTVLIVLAFCLATCVTAQTKKPTAVTAPSIVGDWIVDPRIKDPNRADKTALFRFKSDGTMVYKTKTVNGLAKYMMKGRYGTITVVKRNGVKPRMPSESTGRMKLSSDGKVLSMLDSGGSTEVLRLVRRK
jgi:hypothetical protein